MFLEDIQVQLDFFVIDNRPLDVIIGLPALKSFQTWTDPGTHTVVVRHEEEEEDTWAPAYDVSEYRLSNNKQKSLIFRPRAIMNTTRRNLTSFATLPVGFQITSAIQKHRTSSKMFQKMRAKCDCWDGLDRAYGRI